MPRTLLWAPYDLFAVMPSACPAERRWETALPVLLHDAVPVVPLTPSILPVLSIPV